MTTVRRVVELTPERMNELNIQWLGPERRSATIAKMIATARALIELKTEQEVAEWARWQDPCGVPFGELEPYLVNYWREVRRHKAA